MKKIVFTLTLVVLIPFFASGCATIIKGYESRVELFLAADSLRVTTYYGEELTVYDEQFRSRSGVTGSKAIYLRSDRPHILQLTRNDKTKIVSLYPKLDPAWFVIDLLCGGVPILVDNSTGCWNYFDDIDASIK